MKNNKEKSNAEHLKVLLTTIKGILPKEGEEALEFLDAMEDEMIDLGDEVRVLKDQIDDLETKEKDEDEDSEEGLTGYETSDLGLDTLHWQLENGNIVIDGLMEDFIQSVQKKYALIAS